MGLCWTRPPLQAQGLNTFANLPVRVLKPDGEYQYNPSPALSHMKVQKPAWFANRGGPLYFSQLQRK
jgi:hypothetical protein